MIHHSSRLREHRDMVKVKSSSRKRCDCGCKTMATHIGRGQGAAMVVGCELMIRRWIRDGHVIFKQKS